MNTKKIYILIIILLSFFTIGMSIKNNIDQTRLINKIEENNKKIIEMSELIKEKDGQYSKLVNYFSDSKKLSENLKNSNKELAKELRKTKEQILKINDIVATFKEKKDTGNISFKNDSLIGIDIFYPDSNDWFINWKGKIFTKDKKYTGKWIFTDLKIKAILTETEEGLWKARIVGPKFLVINSMEINSLPPKDYTDEKIKKISFLFGGGYLKSFDNNYSNAIGITGGIQWKNKHIIQLTGTTNNILGIQFLYKFK